MQEYKREVMNDFWSNFVKMTPVGLTGGLVVAAVIAPSKIATVYKSPLVPLYAGILGGVALSECAKEFNQL